jgi:hypothetical protein
MYMGRNNTQNNTKIQNTQNREENIKRRQKHKKNKSQYIKTIN